MRERHPGRFRGQVTRADAPETLRELSEALSAPG